MEGLIRQGDILFVPMEEKLHMLLVNADRDYVRRKPNEGIIVAEGEATGHHHRIRTPGARLYRHGRTVYLTVPKGGAELTHEEHETITIPQGVYRVDNQREYVASAAPRRVWD